MALFKPLCFRQFITSMSLLTQYHALLARRFAGAHRYYVWLDLDHISRYKAACNAFSRPFKSIHLVTKLILLYDVAKRGRSSFTYLTYFWVSFKDFEVCEHFKFRSNGRRHQEVSFYLLCLFLALHSEFYLDEIITKRGNWMWSRIVSKFSIMASKSVCCLSCRFWWSFVEWDRIAVGMWIYACNCLSWTYVFHLE